MTALNGCTALDRGAVVAATGTVIGVEIGAAAGTGAPNGTLGYRRAEYAYVPANRGGSTADKMVNDVPNVIMELSYGGTLVQDGRIYQRLAVGTTAVQQAQASGMFLRDASGKLDPAALKVARERAATTMARAATLVDCVTHEDRVDREALARIVDRARTKVETKAAVEGYVDALGAVLTRPQLQAILAQSDLLAEALDRHVSNADCAEADDKESAQ